MEQNEGLSMKGVYLYYLLYFLVLPMGFLIRTFYSRALTPEEFGMIYALIGFFGFLSIFANFGFSSSLRHFIPKYLVEKNYVKIRNVFWYSFISQFLLVIVYVILIFLFSSFLVENYFDNQFIEPLLYAFLLYFIFNNFFSFLTDILVAYKKNVQYQTLHFIQLLLILVFSIFFFIYGFENLPFYFSLSWGISPLLIFIAYIFIICKNYSYLLKRPRYDKSLIKEHFSYSFAMFASAIGMKIILKSDIVMLTYFVSLSSLGFYSNAVSIVDIIVSLFASISILLMPLFSELWAKKSISTITSILYTLYGLILYLVLPLALLAFLFPQYIIETIFGTEYLPGASVLGILALFVIFKIFLHFNLSFINGLGDGKKLIKIVFPIALLNIVLNFILIPQLGIMGAAYSTIASWILLFIFTLLLLVSRINHFLNVKKIFLIGFSALIYIFLILLLKDRVDLGNFYITSVLIILFSFTIYLILGYLLKIYRINDLYIFIPSKKIKQTLKAYHKKYLPTLK